MARGFRCTVVWLGASLGSAATAWLLRSEVAALGHAATWESGFEAALVPVCAGAVVLCAAWFWCVTTVTTVEVLRGASPDALAGRGGAARRLVLTLCGVAVASQLAAPAHAVPGADRPDDLPSLAGLSVPDRAVAGVVGQRKSRRVLPLARPGFRDVTRAAGSTRVQDVAVRPGDSLWSIAEGVLGPEADVARLVDHWHRTYAANRDVIGADPDLILPGQHLSLPPDHPTDDQTHPSSDDSDHEEQR